MGVYDCIVAHIECPNCNTKIRWLEQLKLGYHRMDTFVVGDKIKGCNLNEKWDREHCCNICNKNMRIIYFIDNGYFKKCTVYSDDYKIKLVYKKQGKVLDNRATEQIQNNRSEIIKSRLLEESLHVIDGLKYSDFKLLVQNPTYDSQRELLKINDNFYLGLNLDSQLCLYINDKLHSQINYICKMSSQRETFSLNEIMSLPFNQQVKFRISNQSLLLDTNRNFYINELGALLFEASAEEYEMYGSLADIPAITKEFLSFRWNIVI